jgi:putative ABC transport system permease protein
VIVLRLVYESFIFALQALRSNVLRTLLSLLGVTVGIFAIILVFTLVDALESGVRQSLSFIGDRVVYVQKWPWSFAPNYPWWKYINRPDPTYQEFSFLQENISGDRPVSIFAGRRTTVKQASNSIRAYFQGMSYEHKDVADIPIERGRYFTPIEVETGQNVAIIGANVAETLYPRATALDKEINVNGRKFRVIGVMKRVGENLLDAPSNDDNVYVPFGAFRKVYYSGPFGGVSATIAIKGGADEDPELQELEAEVQGLMRQVRRLRPREEDSFALNKPQMLANFITNIFGVITFAGAIIGSFAILIGGFGIANIMFVSVRERTNQIGVQKSLGAKNYFILFQFLFEATLLSLIGGFAGLFLVWLITFIPMGSLEPVMSLKNISIGLILAAIIGMFSGLIPAWVAARLDPVIAIRTTA